MPVLDKKLQRYLPGLLALLTAAVLMLGLLVLMENEKPEPDDPIPTTMPPVAENPYGPEDFTYDERGYLTCTAGESVLGIDISSHQEEIDWEAVKNAGVEFVMIRAGYRGYTAGAVRTDPMAQEYYRGASAAGLKVGVYFFSQAITVQEAVAEAEYLINVIRGWNLEMPVVFDWEFIGSDARTANMDRRLLTDCAAAFCKTVERAGYKPMVYFNVSLGRDMLYLEELTRWDWWLAKYSGGMNYPHAVRMWQYTDEGRVPGIDGPVDLNLWLR